MRPHVLQATFRFWFDRTRQTEWLCYDDLQVNRPACPQLWRSYGEWPGIALGSTSAAVNQEKSVLRSRASATMRRHTPRKHIVVCELGRLKLLAP